ncbi:mannitol dehydrogenase family protein [Vibrio penaeicida]|uniref:mannitol dehydrogenase family protein n=1 Tax=Vibrio penaeicida TaxID=104609 RepID=UPI000CEA5675|nr:mannitol dehydrogenase family protein [Vibrio penaeicida]
MTFKCDSQTTYSRDELQPRIVHIGCGAFHRGHQAVYNDICNELSQEALWGIAEVSLRGSTSIAKDLTDQEFEFCVLETNAVGSETRLVRTVIGATDIAHEGLGKVLRWFGHDDLRIVSLTITEKGYCVDPLTGRLDLHHPDIAHDLSHFDAPKSAIGLIALALKLRYTQGLAGVSVLSCDNMPENGLVLKAAVMDFLYEMDPLLASWAKEHVSFPSTMVDRIVPAMTHESKEQLQQSVGKQDKCGVIGESFRQWVIEDNFVSGRPDWDKAGANLVEDVIPFEEMKLRLLNGSHTFMAIIGSLMDIESVSQGIANPKLKSAVSLLMNVQKRSLNPELNIDINEYTQALITRFENPNIVHLLSQIAMDSSQKIPVRIIQPMRLLQEQGEPVDTHIFLLSAWVRFVEQFFQDGFSDPKSENLATLLVLRDQHEPKVWCRNVLVASGFFNRDDVLLTQLLPAISDGYTQIKTQGMEDALTALLSNSSNLSNALNVE